jgi:hypothetical protein
MSGDGSILFGDLLGKLTTLVVVCPTSAVRAARTCHG